jgi:hypothetical protein
MSFDAAEREVEVLNGLKRMEEKPQALIMLAPSPSSAKSNIGMHPTADTLDFMLRDRRGAAGDAGR